jgi:malate synthase
MSRVEKAGLRVDLTLATFINDHALPGSGVEPERFWEGLSALIHEFGPRNRALLERRDEIQSALDAWHVARRGKPADAQDQRGFLTEIGYLVPEGEDFQIETAATDPEFASLAGPQLVVPITNARYVLNAANARWGSLYDALYGTDAMGDLPRSRGYDGRARRPRHRLGP